MSDHLHSADPGIGRKPQAWEGQGKENENMSTSKAKVHALADSASSSLLSNEHLISKVQQFGNDSVTHSCRTHSKVLSK